MRSIPHPSMASAMHGGNSSFYGTGSADTVNRQSVSGYQNLTAGLTIKTRDGDLVTLTSNSFFQFDAFKYNREGVVQTETGLALNSQNSMEMTLSSGEIFTFSVDGNLSEAELQDIKGIIKEVDEIIAEMVDGDMAGAVEKALEMDAYDTVSMYTADISLKKQVRTVTETSSRAGAAAPWKQRTSGHDELSGRLDGMKAFSDSQMLQGRRARRAERFEKLVDQMTERLQQHSEKQVVRSGKAVDKLFRHHLEQENETAGKEAAVYRNLEKMAERVSRIIKGMAEKFF